MFASVIFRYCKILVLAACLSSCAFPVSIFSQEATVHYVGETFAARQAVDTYYDEQDVKRPYRVIGRMTNDLILQYEPEDVKSRMQEKAAAVGGDAIIVTDIMPARVKDELDKIILKAKVIKYL